MDQMLSFDAILFPSDGRAPHLVKLMTSPMPGLNPNLLDSQQARMPHPEVHMDYIAEIGSRAWQYHVRTVQKNYLSRNTESPVACRSPGWYEQELHEPIHNFLPNHLTRRNAVPAQQGPSRDSRKKLQGVLRLEGKHRRGQVS
jgi:hypothetical protein